MRHASSTAFACSIGLFICIALASCATLDRAPSKQGSYTFILSGPRKLELEPCGCQMASVGGAAREVNLLKTWKSEGTRLYITGGQTFTSPEIDPKRREYLDRKVTATADVLDLLGVNVLVPSVSDLAIGIERLQSIDRDHNFRMVHSNLIGSDGKPLFATSFRNGKAVVVALTDKAAAAKSGVSVRPPVEALSEVLAGIDDDVFLVLVSDLGSKALKTVERAFPRIGLVMDVSEGSAPSDVVFETATRLYVRPSDRGTELTRVDLEFPEAPARKLYNAETQGRLAYESLTLKGRLLRARRAGKSDRLKNAITSYERRLAEIEPLLIEGTENFIRYSADTRSVSRDFEGKENAVSRRIERFKGDVRELALNEAEK